MINNYVIILSDVLIDRDELITFLEEKKAITTWEYCLPVTLFVKSALNGKQISDLLEEKYGNTRHYISKISTDDAWGRLPKGFWDFFK
jgi:hypothetical protein